MKGRLIGEVVGTRNLHKSIFNVLCMHALHLNRDNAGPEGAVTVH
jgi:hypothetical protein